MTNPFQIALKRYLLATLAVALCVATANAAVPGIAGAASTPTFNLNAGANYITQPDGMTIYAWGYGCAPSSTPTFLPTRIAGTCSTMQMPGPTLIVHEGDTVTVNLTNNLPAGAGNTSIVFTGFPVVTPTGGSSVQGLLTQEALPGGKVTYIFTASKPGTYSYSSGTRPDLQVEMGMFGALIVLPTTVPSGCVAVGSTHADIPADTDFRLAASAYDNVNTCFDREYLFQFSELSVEVHQQVEAQVLAGAAKIQATIEPYHPEYFLVNGRSMPDDMDPNYASVYPHQPYNGNPHMHPGDLVLMRVIGQGRWQHPFHHHGNHARVVARDGNLITSITDIAAGISPMNQALAGNLVFTVPTVSGQSVDAIFAWTGQGLNWDVYGPTTGTNATHATCNSIAKASPGLDPVTKEYCPDHGKIMPVTTPDKNIVQNGLWYGGSPYLGTKVESKLLPGTTELNTVGSYAYMWHSHDEREITTNDVFPGGMMMMLLIDPPTFAIDEAQ